MPAPVLTEGTPLLCPFGMAPSMLNVIPTSPVLANGLPAATMFDVIPFVNILPFGMCTSLANPMVAAATAAALGALIPMPCIPVPVSPWIPPSPVLLAGQPAATMESSCMCAWGGVIRPLVSPALEVLLA